LKDSGQFLKVSNKTFSFRLSAFFLFLLSSLNFQIFAVQITAENITHRALLFHAGNETYDAMLSTKTAEDTSATKWGSRKLKIHFESNEKANEVTFQTNDDGQKEGIKMSVAKKDEFKIQLTDLESKKSAKDLKATFCNSVFTIEDLSLQFLGWKKQELKGEEEVKGQTCWKIICYPDSKEPSDYSRVEVWIDQQHTALLKAIAYDSQENIVKEFIVRSVQQLDDESWMLKTLELRAPKANARSELEILRPASKE
jgi:hypothetical protein